MLSRPLTSLCSHEVPYELMVVRTVEFVLDNGGPQPNHLLLTSSYPDPGVEQTSRVRHTPWIPQDRDYLYCTRRLLYCTRRLYVLYTETICTVHGDYLYCTQRLYVLYTETISTVHRDYMYCTQRLYVLYTETISTVHRDYMYCTQRL